MDMSIEHAVKVIEESGEYELLRKFYPVNQYHTLPNQDSIKIGCIIDCETTGLNTVSDMIIEIGAIFFQYDTQTGRVGEVLHSISAFEDPRIEIPPEIIDLTGITNDMVKDKEFPDIDFNSWIHMSSLIIAHNANFDRKMLERRFPILESKHWACSIENIPWKEEGVKHKGLEMLALYYKYFFEAHRALYDSEFVLHLLTLNLPRSNQLILKALLDNAKLPLTKIWADGSSFDNKEALKTYGFSWAAGEGGAKKGWYIVTPKDKIDEILEFLISDVFLHDNIKPSLESISTLTRFSIRA